MKPGRARRKASQHKLFEWIVVLDFVVLVVATVGIVVPYTMGHSSDAAIPFVEGADK